MSAIEFEPAHRIPRKVRIWAADGRVYASYQTHEDVGLFLSAEPHMIKAAHREHSGEIEIWVNGACLSFIASAEQIAQIRALIESAKTSKTVAA